MKAKKNSRKKKGSSSSKSYFIFSSDSSRGQKEEMEDDLSFKPRYLNNEKSIFFGVYDGHSGCKCAQFIAEKIPEQLENLLSLPKSPYDALKECYSTVDKMWLEHAKEQDPIFRDGSTAISLLIKDGVLYVANAGDSRAIMCDSGNVISLSKDQKPDDPVELERILRNGGIVWKGRVLGELAVARAFGDIDFKDPVTLGERYITSEPEVEIFELTPEVEFIICACDGVWDVFNNEDAISFVKRQMEEGTPLETMAHVLVQEAFYRNSKDNLSAIIVFPQKKFKNYYLN